MLRQKLAIVAFLTISAGAALADDAQIGITGNSYKGFAVFIPATTQAIIAAKTVDIRLANGSKKQLKDATLNFVWALNTEKTETYMQDITIRDAATKKDYTIGGGKNAITGFTLPNSIACFGIDAKNFPRSHAKLTLDGKTIAEIKVSGSGLLDTNGSTVCSNRFSLNEKSRFAVKSDALQGATFYSLTLTNE